jgi:hypothetical protein
MIISTIGSKFSRMDRAYSVEQDLTLITAEGFRARVVALVASRQA